MDTAKRLPGMATMCRLEAKKASDAMIRREFLTLASRSERLADRVIAAEIGTKQVFASPPTRPLS